MRFHALLLVRDEGDIIRQTLTHTLTWCDALYVFDTGSTDDTWAIVQDIAALDPRVILLHHDPIRFDDGTRAYGFSQIRPFLTDGDWVLRIDADEFYHVTPPKFVRTALQPHETCVYNQSYDFRLTQQEVEDWENGRETMGDRHRPIAARRRFYQVLQISEPRMFRYRSTMQWLPHCSFPYNAGYVAKARIPIRHYPHRDPVQLQQRCQLRATMAQASENVGRHWLIEDWQQLIVPDSLSGLQYWEPGKPLPEYQFTNHLAPYPKRLLQRLTHQYLLPVLDRTRPAFPT